MKLLFFCLQFFSGTENLQLSEYGCVQLALSKQYLIFGSLKDPFKQHTVQSRFSETFGLPKNCH